MTAYASAKAILLKAGKGDYISTVYVDGLNKKEEFYKMFSKKINPICIRTFFYFTYSFQNPTRPFESI